MICAILAQLLQLCVEVEERNDSVPCKLLHHMRASASLTSQDSPSSGEREVFHGSRPRVHSPQSKKSNAAYNTLKKCHEKKKFKKIS